MERDFLTADGSSIHETVVNAAEVVSGKPVSVTITKQRGLQWYASGGRRVRIVSLTIKDYGPKLGTAVAYTLAPETEATAEEKARNRAAIQEVWRNIVRSGGVVNADKKRAAAPRLEA